MLLTFILILIVSFILALSSMKDFNVPSEINHLIQGKKVRGKIVFFKNKVVHYRAKRS
ncbi:MAG: hypothetical protein NUV87_03470 [Candidatus Roizmanbacteria bacterium]|nr:hypothetical protein [Candidatus Roizmanbacteria bacterium]MCR4312861.1 hypothetical protein [Candidatus Roizmanbacteria bacterium]